ncbi:MAG: hypothetical protein ABIH21_03365 [Patescibacteria group bacterium]
MPEGKDPYLVHREKQAKAHKVLRTIEFKGDAPDVEPNKDRPNPVEHVTLEEVAWSPESTQNIIDAIKRGWVSVEIDYQDNLTVEFLPIDDLPAELGQVTEKPVFKKNLVESTGLYGDSDNEKFTYLQTTEFAVEGYMDDESHGQEYARLYVDTDKLKSKRNVYLDPECIWVTDYEYPKAFIVKGGIPIQAIERADVIRANPIPFKMSDDEGWEEKTEEQTEQEMAGHARRLKEFLQNKKAA